MNPKKLFWEWMAVILALFVLIGALVIMADPFFHYHSPYTDRFFYPLDNERSQNDGIIRHFEYDAMIVGTSLTENFETTEMDALFGVQSVKVPYAGGSYKEMNDTISRALKYQSRLHTVVRALDYGSILSEKDHMRTGEFPTYLYDQNPFNDVKYLFNRVVPMIYKSAKHGFEPGITAFDEYSRWHYKSGVSEATLDGVHVKPAGNAVHLSVTEKERITENITQNVTSLAVDNPGVEFYYYITPYSALWWETKLEDGTIYRQIEAERVAAELILSCENIHLYSFNNFTELTTNINNYTDPIHYAEWINSMILKWIHEGKGLLTRENYEAYLQEELDFYTTYDYAGLNNQEDYEAGNDYYAAALWNEELKGVKPIALFTEACEAEELFVPDADDYSYLVFKADKPHNNTLPKVRVYDENDVLLAVFQTEEQTAEIGLHQYTLLLKPHNGEIQIVFDGSNDDGTGCLFSEAYLF